MKNLQEATERICELKGSLVALDALLPALIDSLAANDRARLEVAFETRAEAARTVASGWVASSARISKARA